MMIVNFGQIELDQIDEISERQEESARQSLREHNSKDQPEKEADHAINPFLLSAEKEAVDAIDDDSDRNNAEE